MRGGSYQFVKRLLDITGSCIGLFVFGLLYLPIGLLIKLDSPGPILVKLTRVSQGKHIALYKFRSMIENAHALKPELQEKYNERSDGPFFKMRRDPRITRVGRIIRKFRLDEFPQFINVFTGELSLVGPRPHEPSEVAQYPRAYAFLPQEKAGITGLSQVRGASSLPYMRELELDSYYVTHKSLWLDLYIIGKTASIIFFDPTAV